MIYPPLLFHSFRWLRALSLETAMRIWTSFVCVAFAAILYAWARRIARQSPGKEGAELALFCSLLLLQYPVVFTLERGGTDVGALLLFTAGAYAFTRFGPVWGGFATGLAAAYKLYPLISVAVIVIALVLTVTVRRPAVAPNRRGAWLHFALGAFIAFLLASLAYFSEARIYFTKILPVFAKKYTGASVYGHSVPSTVGADYPVFSLLLVAALLSIWCWAAGRAFARGDAASAFAGALAVSTYAQKTSWDYNLVTTYPLLVLLFMRAQRENRFALVAFGLFAIVGDRRLFAGKGPEIFSAEMHVALQLAFLAMAAVALARDDNDSASRPALVS